MTKKTQKNGYNFTNVGIKKDIQEKFSILCKKEHKTSSDMLSILVNSFLEKNKKIPVLAEETISKKEHVETMIKLRSELTDMYCLKEDKCIMVPLDSINKKMTRFATELSLLEKDKGKIFNNDISILEYLFEIHTEYLCTMLYFAKMKSILNIHFPAILESDETKKIKYTQWQIMRKFPFVLDDMFDKNSETHKKLEQLSTSIVKYISENNIEEYAAQEYVNQLKNEIKNPDVSENNLKLSK